MRRTARIAGVVGVVLLGSVSAASAQIAIRAKAGTTGIGADVALGIAPRVALRVGVTVMPVKPEGTFSDINFRVDLPSPLFTAGADLQLLGGLRLMGGVLVGARQTDIVGVYNGTVNIGGRNYTGAELGRLLGEVHAKNLAPFVGLGFGKTVGPGIGFSVDLGGAFLGEPALALNADGQCTQIPQCNAELRQNLDREAAQVQDDLNKYGRIYPIISLGLRLGFGPK